MEANRTEAAPQLNESAQVTYAEIREYDDSALRFVQDLQKLVHQSGRDSRYTFRGHACASHRLVPSLLRNPSVKRIIENESFFLDLLNTWKFPVDVKCFRRPHQGQIVFEEETYLQTFSVTADTAIRLLVALTCQYIEDRLVKEFLKSANAKVFSYNYLHNDSSMPPPTPILATHLLPIETAIERQVQETHNGIFAELPSIVDLFSKPSLKQTSIAAHEGVPTSALDFTQDPLIAAWFACAHRTDGHEYDTEYISVAAFDQYRRRNRSHELDPTSISPIPAYTYDTPKQGNDRAQAQKSTLCLSKSFYLNLAFLTDIPLSDVLHYQLLFERRVYQFALHKSRIPELFGILSANGVDDAFVMQRTDRLVHDVVRRTLDPVDERQ